MSNNTLAIKRSPLFYVGDKYKLMKQILNYIPTEINNYYEPFVGGGTVFLNINAKNYILNDINKHLINIHKFLVESSNDPNAFFNKTNKIIKKYNLSHSYLMDIVPDTLKKRHKKTYYAHFNKQGYDNLKAQVNSAKVNNPLILYLLLIYGFNRMLRFNGGGKFNLPVGNVDFNKNVEKALLNYFSFCSVHKIKFYNLDFEIFLKDKSYSKGDYIYLDPPYLITSSEYNKIWNEDAEKRLYSLLDDLTGAGIRFGLSNITHYKDKRNGILISWMKKYNSNNIKSNYISYHDNSDKIIKEVFITNY